MSSSLLAGRTVEGLTSARIRIDGRDYINFFGSGYLALANLREIRLAVRQALEQGATFARQMPAAVGAIDPIFDEVERAGAVACGTEASIYFPTGYFIGSVGIKALDLPVDLLLLDETAHYNLKDAARLTGLPSFEFAHCDAQSLEQALKKHLRPGQRPLVVTDGVFATSGRVAPLADYAALVAPYDGRLLVDEAHAFGVVGSKGRGASEYCGVEQITVMGATLSKAYCAQGALVGCSNAAASRVRVQSPVRGACAGSPLSAVAASASLAYVDKHPELRVNLRTMSEYLRARLRDIGLDVIDSPAPIVSFRLGNRAEMQALQRRVFDRGIHIYHSSYLGAGAEGMIRCAVFRDHSKQDIDALVDALQ